MVIDVVWVINSSQDQIPFVKIALRTVVPLKITFELFLLIIRNADNFAESSQSNLGKFKARNKVFPLDS